MTTDLPPDWSIKNRTYGIGTCTGGSGPVLCRGKWGVIGSTGKYKILHPTGWIEDSPTFETETQAIIWVNAKFKAMP